MKFFRRENNELMLIVLRYALGSVFLWFGLDKWVNPEAWYGWIPGWLLVSLPLAPPAFMAVLGSLEFAAGTLLVAGKLVRETAAAVFLFLLAVFLSAGAHEVSIRDNGLMGIALALFIQANGRSARPLPARWLSLIAGAYVFFLFISGMLYLKNAS